MNVQIRFSGIFLLSRPAVERPDPGSIARILLPNTIGVPLPGNGTAPHSHVHHGFLVQHNGTPNCTLPEKSQTLLHLYHADVVFRFDRNVEPGTPDPAGQMDFSHYVNQPLLPLGTFTPALRLRSDLHPHDRSPDARLGGRVTISRGSFTTCPAVADGYSFVMRNGDPGNQMPITPAQHLNCNVIGADAVLIDFRYDKKEKWRTLELTPDEKGNVHLTVGFLCDEDPVDWSRRNRTVNRRRNAEVVDEDFLYLYNLLQPRRRSGDRWPPEGGFHVPVAVPAQASRGAKTKTVTTRTIRGATTSTCFPGDCPGC